MLTLPHYSSMNAYLFSAIILAIIYLIIKYRKLSGVVKKVYKKIDEIQKTFGNHFEVTDKTIIEERKEKKYWKNRAIKAEKLLPR